MSTRKVHITNGMAWGDRHDRDDWTRPTQAFRTLDGEPVKYSPEWYEREDEREGHDGAPRTILDSWPFLISLTIATIALFCGVAWGYI